jgi:hypothetical protein
MQHHLSHRRLTRKYVADEVGGALQILHGHASQIYY